MANITIGLFKLVLGAIFIILGVLSIFKWLPQLLDLIKGSIGICIGITGLLLVILAFSDFRN